MLCPLRLSSYHKRLSGIFISNSRIFNRLFNISPAVKQDEVELGPGNILKSPIVFDVPEDISLYNFITSEFHKHGEKPAMIDGATGHKISYSYLHLLIKKFGSLLKKQGIKEQECIGIYSPNCIEYPTAVLGNAGIGGVTTTANPLLTVEELANQMRDCKAKYLVTKNAFLHNAKAAADLAGIDKIFLFDEPEKQENGVLGWSAITDDDGTAFTPKEKCNAKEEVVFLPYSSGTTGKPKGVMLTHHSVISIMLSLREVHSIWPNVPQDVSLGLVPYFHIFGLAVPCSGDLYEGKTVVSLSGFEPQTFLSAIANYKVQVASVVPPLFMFLARHPLVDKFDLSSLSMINSGGAALGRDVLSAFKQKFPKVLVTTGLGLTEGIACALSNPELTESKPGSIGIPMPNTEMRIVDVENRKALGPNAVGEIEMRSPSVMKGYINNPEETAKSITKDGWLASGDLGYYDDDYHFFIVDRIKELIKYKGFQVSPSELEDLMLSHPNVADVAVIGIPDEEAGELPRAFVIRKGEITEEELMEFVKERVAPHKRIRGGVDFVDSIPKTPSGKILRRQIKETVINRA